MDAELKEWTEDELSEWLDDLYEPIEYAGMTICASDMKTIDPIMFRCAASDMEDVWICGECDAEYSEEDEANSCCFDSCESSITEGAE